MNPLPSPLILIGVGGAGSAMARGVMRAYGPGIRALAIDTDAGTGSAGDGVPFILLGGNRLAGRGTGGQPASARASFQDNPSLIDPALGGARIAVVVTALGGGTGGGATGELLRHLHSLGIVSLLFATMPFGFEGEERMRVAKTSAGPICQQADVSVILPLDQLVAGTDNMKDALAHGIDTLASGVTLLWRILEKPGYISLDAERLRRILSGCGRARFGVASATGEDRALQVLKSLAESPLVGSDAARPPVRAILAGILGGDDLRLSEVGAISSGLTAAFGEHATLDLGTVNDEATFSGRLVVVTLLFEESAVASPYGKDEPRGAASKAKGERTALAPNSRFRHAEQTIWNGENLDVPTFYRRQLTLDI